MNRHELYKKTVDILFDAYFNDTLRHTNCYACACGNIIAANQGYKFVPSKPGSYMLVEQNITWDITDGYYAKAGRSSLAPWYPVVNHNRANDLRGIEQIQSTGYSVDDFMLIEKAFELAAGFGDEWMFNGLVAVLDVLKQIHEVTDNEPEVTRFRKHYQSLCS
jgi:hypothetical protein